MCLGKMLDARKNKGSAQPYLRNPNVQWFDVDLSNVGQMRFEDHEEARYGLLAGDVLICEGGQAGRAAIWDGRVPGMKFQKAIHRVRCGPRLNNRYLVHRLMADYASGRLADYYTGATIKHLTGQDLARYRFALPPIPEQKRIADILDKADALRAKRRAAAATLQSLMESIFIEMFGSDDGTGIASQFTPIGEVADVQGGLQVTSARKALPLEVPYLRVANVYRGYLDLTEIKRIRTTQAEFSRTVLARGDFLIVEGHGNPAELGRGSMWDGSIPDCVHQNHLIRVRFDAERVLPPFAEAFLNSRHGRRHLIRAGNTTSGLNTISVADVRSTPMLVPPLDSQRAYARQAESVREAILLQRRSARELDVLFSSLQHRAFRGELSASSKQD